MENNKELIKLCEEKAQQWLSPAFDEETRALERKTDYSSIRISRKRRQMLLSEQSIVSLRAKLCFEPRKAMLSNLRKCLLSTKSGLSI